jgi:nicotinate-nucleotide pyrophosphorylase (carboxylating)
MAKDFRQIEWDAAVEEDCRQLVRLAVREDLDRIYDWTTVALIPPEATGRAEVVVRESAVVSGLAAGRVVLDEMESGLTWTPLVEDGAHVAPGTSIARVEGPARSLLTCERTLLNFIGRLSGIATWTRQFVDAVASNAAQVYDTRKTTPGWRRLEKYAVRCGGGRNHRCGLFDAILIKDNHLALSAAGGGAATPSAAVRAAREFAAEQRADERLLIEIEVDTLAQLDDALSADPDAILLDNMSLDQLREAVARRNAVAPDVVLEASGGVNLTTIGDIARTGVERISVGALTHGARSVDVGLDWLA